MVIKMSFRAVYRLYSLPLFALTSVLAADPSWVSNSANAGIFTSMAFDAERGKMAVFAETAYDGSLGGTWTWDRSHWTLEHPVHSPSSRDGAAMAYDPVRKEVVLFGGYGTNGNYSDTWTWNGVDWTQRMPSASPSARSFSAMAFDADRQQIVLFGGGVKNSGTFLDSFSDTWIWDGSNWSQKSPTASPSRRANHAMVYSSSQHKILLYGGGGYIGGGFGTPATDETWTWNGTNWTLENPAAKPGPRENFAMAWDPVRQIVVLWGQVWLGYNAETWIWDGTNWIRKTSAESPGARRWPAMAYDEVLQRVVLVGGENHMNLTEAWTWDGSTWGVTGVADPYDVYQNTLLYDTANQEILDLGLDRSNVYSRLWRWDGTTWSRQLLSNAPDRKDLAIFAFDSAHDEVLMVASTTSSFSANDETWSLKNGAWTKRSNAAPPGFRRRMVFDKARNEILLLSLPNGQPSASWNGSAWVSKPSTTVPTFTDFEMAYDDARQQVVAFGSGQTWIWDGSTWVNKTPAVSPSNRSGHAMAYDDQRQLVLLWGGLQAGVHVHDTWSWDGTAWTQFSTAISPPEIHPSMAFDSARKQLMLRGDNGANQTWFLDWGPLSNTFAYQVTSMPPGPVRLCGRTADPDSQILLLAPWFDAYPGHRGLAAGARLAHDAHLSVVVGR